jgi:hypothetical protein
MSYFLLVSESLLSRYPFQVVPHITQRPPSLRYVCVQEYLTTFQANPWTPSSSWISVTYSEDYDILCYLFGPRASQPDTSKVTQGVLLCSLPWTYPQHGAKFVFVDALSQCNKHTHVTSAVARRRRKGLLVLWKRPRRSGRLTSVKNGKQRPQRRR